MNIDGCVIDTYYYLFWKTLDKYEYDLAIF